MKVSDVKYGKIERSTIIDNKGSTMTESFTMHDGQETDVKIKFEIRTRVETEKDVLEEFLKFRSETSHMSKAEFKIVHTALGNRDGYFYVVRSWTEVGR